MVRFLPLIFLTSIFSIFGLSLLVWYIDPDQASWYIYAIFVMLVFCSLWGLLGTILYFLRIRFYKRYSPKWYFYTSFKMAFFIALFVAEVMLLAILQLVTPINLFLAISAVILFALWSYLGKVKDSH